ncbi:MAG: polysaccharide deacetylase family protein [Nitriliruptoraceae bacterium]
MTVTSPARSGTYVRARRPLRLSGTTRLIAVFVAVIVVLGGCSSGRPGGDRDSARSPGVQADPQPGRGDDAEDDDSRASGTSGEAGTGGTHTEPTDPPDRGQPPLPDPASVGANELGVIPIIMYHRINDDGGSDYDNTTAEFQRELRLLYDAGYRPVRVVDLVDGTIDLPAGTSPVVLTFDDSSPSQFRVDEIGAPHPNTAVGMLYSFAAAHPDFIPTGTMYVLGNPFGATGERAARLLQELDALGFEVGNHTLDHGNLRQLGNAGAVRDLANGAQHVEQAIGIGPRTLALPFGVWPDDRDVVRSGTYASYTYQHDGIVLVGAGPSPSPFSAAFDPLAIPRIRSQPDYDPDDEPDYGSGYWLWLLEQEPERKYVSDGHPELVSFPAELADQLDPRFADRANPY